MHHTPLVLMELDQALLLIEKGRLWLWSQLDGLYSSSFQSTASEYRPKMHIHVWGFKTSSQLPATAKNCQSSTGYLITCCQLLWSKLITFWPLTNFSKTPTFAESDTYFKTFWNPCMYMYGWYVKFTYNCTVVMLWVNNLKNVGFVMIGSFFYFLDSRYILP